MPKGCSSGKYTSIKSYPKVTPKIATNHPKYKAKPKVGAKILRFLPNVGAKIFCPYVFKRHHPQ
ncbi:MAG: hypothetical protein J5554_05845 [Paludibacteraceae bacterium]|nr:hypothetical protein [Paludibacteraceae bacterium]